MSKITDPLRISDLTIGNYLFEKITLSKDACDLYFKYNCGGKKKPTKHRRREFLRYLAEKEVRRLPLDAFVAVNLYKINNLPVNFHCTYYNYFGQKEM